MTWAYVDLRDALRAYGAWLDTRAELAQPTRDSHVRYAKYFVDSIYGEHAPRGAWRRSDPVPRTRRLGPDDLRAELAWYRSFLEAAPLARSGIPTYMTGAGLFVKFLTGVRGRSRATSVVRDPAPSRSTAAPQTPGLATAPSPEPPDGWPSEAAVQSAVVAWLVSQGWSIVRVAQTSSREHGVDIVARRDGVDLLVEVKGYPSEMYTTGDRAGQARTYHPATQARTYFGNALLTVLTMRDEDHGSDVVLALPDVQTYRGLADKVKGSLTALRIRVLFIARDGSVSEEPGQG